MKIKISELRRLSLQYLEKIGFSKEDSQIISDHLLTSELSDKKSHGLVRLPKLKKQVDSGKISLTSQDIKILKETPISLHIDGKSKTALIVLDQAVNLALEKAKKNMVCFLGVKNAGPVSGMIGYFARKATKNNLIFIGFHNSPAGLTPFGSKESLWGTNPLTVGIPTKNIDLPLILDMASAKMTYGEVMLHAALNKTLPTGASVDVQGNPTTDPHQAIDGSQLPFEGHKGSGLAMIVEILAGPLVGAKGGNIVTGEGEWGSFIIILNPELYKPLDQFKENVDQMIQELKNSQKQPGVGEIFYPGESSGKKLLKNLELGEIEIPAELLEKIMSIE